MLEEGDPAVVPRARVRERRASDRRAGDRPRPSSSAKELAEDRRHRQEHGGEDPRASRDGQGGEARRPPRRSTLRASSRSCASRALARRRSSGCAPSSACSRSTISGAFWPTTQLRELKGFGPKSEEKLRSRSRTARRAGLDRAHPHRGGAAARRTHRRAACSRCPASPTRRTADRCAGSRRRSATSTSSWRRRRPTPVMEALVSMKRRRSRARPRRRQDERGHPPRNADRSARRRGRTSSARRASTSRARRATTSSSASARWRAAGRSTSTRSPSSTAARSSRARPRSRSTRRSVSRGSRRCCGRTRARSRPRRTGAFRDRSATIIGDFHVHTSVSGDGQSSLEEVVDGREGPRLSRPGDHRPRGGHAVRRRARGAPRAAREDPRAPGRARRFAAPAPRRRAEHRAERRARLRRRIPERFRLVPRVGPRPLRPRSSSADRARRHSDARPGRFG